MQKPPCWKRNFRTSRLGQPLQPLSLLIRGFVGLHLQAGDMSISAAKTGGSKVHKEEFVCLQKLHAIMIISNFRPTMTVRSMFDSMRLFITGVKSIHGAALASGGNGFLPKRARGDGFSPRVVGWKTARRGLP
jgi:hypothetical protein